MIFVNNISELQYYTLASVEECYCERLMSLPDLFLHSALPNDVPGTMQVYAYYPDGLTNYGEVTAGFDIHYGMQGGARYFVLTANAWHPILCANPCFLLRVVIYNQDPTPIFDKLTQLYCLDGCCISPGTITTDGTPVAPVAPVDPSTDPFSTPPALNDCNRPVVTLEVTYDCYDVFGGVFGTNADGTPLKKRFVVEGFIEKLPRDIVRTIVKCRVQRTEITPKYELQASEPIPDWKRQEVEAMLAAPSLTINGKAVIFTGGAPFTKMFKCSSIFRFRLPFEECVKAQRYGCGIPCNGEGAGERAFYGFRKATGEYRAENGVLIGYDTADVAQYLKAQSGIESASMVADPTVGESAFYVTADGPGVPLLPSFLYSGTPVPANRSYRQLLPDYDRNTVFGLPADYIVCKKPVLSAPSFAALACKTPTLSDHTFQDSCKQPILSDYTFAS